jgi:hypothetical protein
MRSLLTYLKEYRNRSLAAALARHGKSLTLVVRESQTVDDVARHPSPDQRYLHAIMASWTDPLSGKTYEFRRQFRSWREAHFKTGDLVKVLVDPQNFRHYVIQI